VIDDVDDEEDDEEEAVPTTPVAPPPAAGGTDPAPTDSQETAPSAQPDAPVETASLPVAEQIWNPNTYYWFDDLDVPLIAGIPLFGSPEHATWALLNLVLTIVGVVLALFIALRALVFKKQDNSMDENSEYYEYNKRRFSWLFAGTIVAIIGIILFIITQNMSNPMVLIDFWTIAHAIFVAVGIVSLVYVVRRHKDNDSDNEEKEFIHAENPA